MHWKLLKDLASLSGLPLFGALKARIMEEALEKDLQRREKGHLIPIETSDPQSYYNPFKALPGCKSILLFGLPYGGFPVAHKDPACGYRSRSAWGQDYHRVLKDRIRDFLKALEETGESFESLAMVDTGPLSERAFAVEAGLGYIGKNQALISPDYGSWVYLGLVLVDFEVEGIPPLGAKDTCGSCQACIKACPTGALEGVYDPRRCISWLTQKKEALSLSESRALGNRLYGCDTCQEICPKNLHIKEGDPVFRDEKGGAVDLRAFLALSKKDFTALYGSSSWSWRGQAILKRNALYVLENAGLLTKRDLEDWIDHPSPLIHEAAREIMKRIEEK